MITAPKQNEYQCPIKNSQLIRCKFVADWDNVRVHAKTRHNRDITKLTYATLAFVEKDQETQLNSNETPEQEHPSGAKSSSGATKFRYLSQSALHALAEHLHDGTDGSGGSVRYGSHNWQKGIEDLTFLADRLEHLQDHAQHLHSILIDIFDTSTPKTIDLKNSPQFVLDMHKTIRGIGCNWMFIQHALEAKLKR